MSYEFYKVIHMTGILAVFLALGAMSMHMLDLGTVRFPLRKWTMLWHGIGLAFVMFSGFGLMAKTGVPQSSWPIWVYLKLAIWLCLGGITALIYRVPKMGRFYWVIMVALGAAGALVANLKPV